MNKLIPQNFYGHYYENVDKIEQILQYQKGSIKDVYQIYENNKKFRRCLNRFLGRIAIKILYKWKKDYYG